MSRYEPVISSKESRCTSASTSAVIFLDKTEFFENNVTCSTAIIAEQEDKDSSANDSGRKTISTKWIVSSSWLLFSPSLFR